MPAVHETAYPRLKEGVTPTDLAEVYTPTAEEHRPRHRARRHVPGHGWASWSSSRRSSDSATSCSSAKSRRRSSGTSQAAWASTLAPSDLLRYDESGTRRRHIPIIRTFLNVRPFDSEARALVAAVVREAAQTKDDLADLMNVAIEELVRNRFELPGFTTLLKEARRGSGRGQSGPLPARRSGPGRGGTRQLDRILTVDDTTGRSPWDAIREDAGRPTLTHLKHLVNRLHWLKTLNVGASAFETIAHVKVEHFAAEAKSLDAARMLEIQPQKRTRSPPPSSGRRWPAPSTTWARPSSNA